METNLLTRRAPVVTEVDTPPAAARPAFDLLLVALVVAIAVVAAFYNCFANGFHLDDQYGIVLNPWIRSLHNIPRYFRDPYTLTTFRSNADYRPVLQITYALNYAISQYNPWSWHIVSLLFHTLVTISVFALGRILFGWHRIRPISWLTEQEGDLVALAAAVLYAVHPIVAVVGNYMWARSSLLVTTFAVPATVLYLRAIREQRKWSGIALPLGLYILALFTKAEAVSLVGVLYLAELLFAQDTGSSLRQSVRPQARNSPGNAGWSLRSFLLTPASWLRLAPFAVSTVAYLGILFSRLPAGEYAGWGAYTRSTYLLTQFRAWWYYIGQMLAPVHQVADYAAYPTSTSAADPRVIYALAGWTCVLGLLFWTARRVPAITFLGLAFFVHLGPHSTIMPLAEIVNEHRPYLPTTGVFLLAALGLFLLVRSLGARAWVFGVVMLLFVFPLGALTHARNRAWVDEFSLWGDTVAKDPESPRAHMNYGIELMKRSQLEAAEGHFRETIRLAPLWNLAHINLAILLGVRGDTVGARQQYDEAVRISPADSASYYWRGMFLSRQGDLNGAIADLQKAADLASVPNLELQALADNLIRAGRLQEAAQAIARGSSLDPATFRPLQQRLAATMSK